MTTKERAAESSSRAEDCPKLGEIAVSKRFLARGQVDECLLLQQELRDRGVAWKLGKILVEKFYLERGPLTAILVAQGKRRGTPPSQVDTSLDVIEFSRAEHDTLVRRVRDRNLLRPEDLDGAIEVQFLLQSHGIDKEIGAIAIEIGVLSREIVSDILSRREATGKTPAVGPEGREGVPEIGTPPFLGALAVEKGLARGEEVERALAIQLRMKELGIIQRIGAILVDLGCLRPPDVQRLLRLQRQRMSRIRWADLGALGPVPPEEEPLVRHLIEHGILSREQVDEARFVQAYMAKLGLVRDLGQTIVDKEYLDPIVIEGISKSLAKGPAGGPSASNELSTSGHQLHSPILEAAYREILLALESKGEVREEEARRPTLEDLATRAPAERAAVRHSRRVSSRVVWIALASVALPLLVLAGVLMIGAAAKTAQERGRLDEARAEEDRLLEESRREEAAARLARAEAERGQARDALLDLLRLLQAPVYTAAEHQRALDLGERLRPRLVGSSLEADLEMVFGRSWYYMVRSSGIRSAARSVRLEWLRKGLACLRRAESLYAKRGSATLVSIRLAPRSPERRLYSADDRFYDASTGRIDYKGSTAFAREDVRRLIRDLQTLEEDLSR